MAAAVVENEERAAGFAAHPRETRPAPQAMHRVPMLLCLQRPILQRIPMLLWVQRLSVVPRMPSLQRVPMPLRLHRLPMLPRVPTLQRLPMLQRLPLL